MTDVEIPYGCYWSTPFVKWQGAFKELHSLRFAAHVAAAELAKRNVSPSVFDAGILGLSVIQFQTFYGLPWFMGLIGAPTAAGVTVNQVCATGARTLLMGYQEIASGLAKSVLVTTCDRTSNGPHIYYPSGVGFGGTGQSENVVTDSFNNDPLGNHSMLQTAENVAKKHGISTEEQHDVVLRRYEQYQMALADNQAFQKRYMSLPFAVPDPKFRKTVDEIEGDVGVSVSNAEGVAKLKPVLEGGTVTFGGQTHPADGNAAIVVANSAMARELSKDEKTVARVLGFGQSRVSLGFMPEAPISAARQALDMAGRSLEQIDVIKTHNPFAVNDVLFAKQTGADIDSMNNYGCSLIWGHPQAPTGTRSIIELIEELAARGGGCGLFTGCAAGDSAMAVIVEVRDRQ